MIMIIESNSVTETHHFAEKIVSQIFPGAVIALIGDLGTGKTTFTQGFAKALGIRQRVGSPTFKLVSEYEGLHYNLYHIDCYRLESAMDFMNIGGEEYLYPDKSVSVIEWADKIKVALPNETIMIQFSRSEEDPNCRIIRVEGLNGEL